MRDWSNEPYDRRELVAALDDAEIEVRAPDDRRVALARVVRPLEHAHAAHDLGDDEVHVGVALAVDVVRRR